MLACVDIMPTGWTPAAASSTLEEWTRTFSRGQQCSCFKIMNRDGGTYSLPTAYDCLLEVLVTCSTSRGHKPDMKLAIGERNVATNLGTISGCVKEYCFSI